MYNQDFPLNLPPKYEAYNFYEIVAVLTLASSRNSYVNLIISNMLSIIPSFTGLFYRHITYFQFFLVLPYFYSNFQYNKSKFLPFTIVFRDNAPTLSANGKTFVFVKNVNLNIRVSAFSIPRILAVFT